MPTAIRRCILFAAALLLFGLVVMTGCDGLFGSLDDYEPGQNQPASCVPNETRACVCPDGDTGVQTCSAEGVFSPCVCHNNDLDAGPTDDADAGTDPDTDVGQPDRDASDPDTDVGEPDTDAGDPQEELDPWEDESGDGVPNQYDNCPYHYNPDQQDTAGDGVGDVCDNCPNVANPDQEYSEDNPVDERGITMGDACAPGVIYVDTVTDSSSDGVPDVKDNCPDYFNPDQQDTSGDGVGDVCDNCPDHYNPDQTATPGNPTYPDRVDAEGDPLVMGDACASEPNDIPLCTTIDEAPTATLAPNVYIALDLSTSMSFDAPSGRPRIQESLEGLDLIAEEFHDEIRFGLGIFPDNEQESCATSHQLDVSNYSESVLKGLWADYESEGQTPMVAIINDINDNFRLQDSADAFDDQRAKAVLLVTGGSPNCSSQNDDEAEQNTVDAITELTNEGIPTFVIGIDAEGFTVEVEPFAEAGGTGQETEFGGHVLADDAEEVAQAMDDVAAFLNGDCTYELEPAPEDSNKIWVHLGGDYFDPDEYQYDESENVLIFDDPACDDIHQSTDDELTIEMGCAVECQPEEPRGLCDLWYETCGAEVACTDCEFEVCDGQDNNCSGTVDDNCPDCGIYTAECESDSDCCEPFVCTEDDLCGHECYPAGVVCSDDDQCCSSQCAISSGEDLGACLE